MAFYTKIAMRYLGRPIEPYLHYFPDLRKNLKKAGMKTTLEEYLSVALLTCLILFVFELPIISFVLSLLGLGIAFSIFMSLTLSIVISFMFFFIFISYPNTVISSKSAEVTRVLPFAGIYLSNIAGSKLPPHKIFEIFSKFDEYGEVSNEAKRIVRDMTAFGLDIYTSLERSVYRTPSTELRDLLWSIMSTLKAGGDLSTYLQEKSKSFLASYRRKLSEFAHSLSIYLEVYLTVLVLGAIFFTILTSIMSGLGGGTVALDTVLVQFFLIYLFIPLVSAAFIVLIKAASPGGE